MGGIPDIVRRAADAIMDRAEEDRAISRDHVETVIARAIQEAGVAGFYTMPTVLWGNQSSSGVSSSITLGRSHDAK